jgi:MFS family permease
VFVGRFVEALLPARMGPAFRRLVAADWVSNLGDGIGLAAGPLLVASQTRDPALVALAALLQRLPWLLFGLWAGVLADRIDRRALAVAVGLARGGMLAVLTVAVATGTVNIGVVLAAMFLLGLAEVFADTALTTLLPTVVAKPDLGIGNARLMTGFLTMNQLIGPAVGAALFAAGAAWPFLAQGVCVAFGAALLIRMAVPALDRPAERSHVWRDIAEGLRWTWHSPPVRTLTLTIVTFNVTFGAAWAVLVLYATERLQLGAVGFGLLTTAMAVGGIVGTASYDWLERHVRLGDIMRVGLVIETLTHLGLALTTTPWVALAIMVVFGAHAFVWGTTSRTVRMRAVPVDLQGRVGSVYAIGVFGGIVVGQAIGGVVARVWGVTGPFWFAFAGSAVILALIWRELVHIAHVDGTDDDVNAATRDADTMGP